MSRKKNRRAAGTAPPAAPDGVKTVVGEGPGTTEPVKDDETLQVTFTGEPLKLAT